MLTDGYNFSAVINGTGGQVRFVYRPMLYAERKATLTAIHHLRGDAAFRLMYDAIVRHLVAWDYSAWIASLYLSNLRLADEAMFVRLWDVICGVDGGDGKTEWTETWERDTASNLREGVILEVTEPQFAKRSCESCKKWWWDDETHSIYKRGGLPILRPTEQVLLCQTAAGCPKGTPEKQRTLTERNRAAYEHYKDCKAIGVFPDDAIVARNARIIETAIQRGQYLKQNPPSMRGPAGMSTREAVARVVAERDDQVA